MHVTACEFDERGLGKRWEDNAPFSFVRSFF